MLPYYFDNKTPELLNAYFGDSRHTVEYGEYLRKSKKDHALQL